MKNLRIAYIILFTLLIQSDYVKSQDIEAGSVKIDRNYYINNLHNSDSTYDFANLMAQRIYDQRMMYLLKYRTLDTYNFEKYKNKPVRFIVEDNINIENFLYAEIYYPFRENYYWFILYYKYNDTNVIGFNGTLQDWQSLPLNKIEAVDSILTSKEYILTFFLQNVNAFKKEIDNAYEVYGTITKTELENCKRLYPKVFK